MLGFAFRAPQVHDKTREQLEKFHVTDLVPDENTFKFRYEALKSAIRYVSPDEI